MNPTAFSYSLNFKIWLLGKTVSTQELWPKAVTILTTDYPVLPPASFLSGSLPFVLTEESQHTTGCVRTKGVRVRPICGCHNMQNILNNQDSQCICGIPFLLLIQGKLLQDDQATDLCKPQHIAAYF